MIILPNETLCCIFDEATWVEDALSTTGRSDPLRLPPFPVPDNLLAMIYSSLRTSTSILRVCKRWNWLGKEYLFRYMIIKLGNDRTRERLAFLAESDTLSCARYVKRLDILHVNAGENRRELVFRPQSLWSQLLTDFALACSLMQVFCVHAINMYYGIDELLAQLLENISSASREHIRHIDVASTRRLNTSPALTISDNHEYDLLSLVSYSFVPGIGIPNASHLKELSVHFHNLTELLEDVTSLASFTQVKSLHIVHSLSWDHSSLRGQQWDRVYALFPVLEVLAFTLSNWNDVALLNLVVPPGVHSLGFRQLTKTWRGPFQYQMYELHNKIPGHVRIIRFFDREDTMNILSNKHVIERTAGLFKERGLRLEGYGGALLFN